ncbi:hypothetical protein M405DRAFT_935149 [Rhizopogon salebrosus TDB-379]|nr:hypothetical protein M405DRAFT_935149 [Rhizopogon salebrosus TDB-379]
MRPTPAPSSPGAERDRRYRGSHEEDVFGDQRQEHPRTPESLPDHRALTNEQQQNTSVADHATGFQTLKDSVSRLQKDFAVGHGLGGYSSCL